MDSLANENSPSCRSIRNQEISASVRSLIGSHFDDFQKLMTGVGNGELEGDVSSDRLADHINATKKQATLPFQAGSQGSRRFEIYGQENRGPPERELLV